MNELCPYQFTDDERKFFSKSSRKMVVKWFRECVFKKSIKLKHQDPTKNICYPPVGLKIGTGTIKENYTHNR